MDNIALLLAVGGADFEPHIPGEHIAATIVPIVGSLIFMGSVYVLLWSIYGAKKGALIYSVAFSAFAMAIGVFWWFGAPGTPIATGVKYFPGQQTNRYVPQWFAMGPGSQRAGYFDVANGTLDAFQTPQAWLDLEGATPEELEADPAYRALVGDLATAADQMLAVYLPKDDSGNPLIGQQRRQRLMQAAGPPRPGEKPAAPFFRARVATEGGEEEGDEILMVAEDRGLRVAGAQLQVVAAYVPSDPNAPPVPRLQPVEQGVFYAFQDPGAIWFPSAVWTAIWAGIFGLSLFGLDRLEQREKRTLAEREPVPAGA